MQNIIRLVIILMTFHCSVLFAESASQSTFLFSQKTESFPFVFTDKKMNSTSTLAMLTPLTQTTAQAGLSNPQVKQIEAPIFEIEEPGVLFIIGLALILFGFVKSWILKRKRDKAINME